MSASAAPSVSLPLTTFFQTPFRLPNEEAVDEYLRRDRPVVHLREEGALLEAQRNASTDPEEDFLKLASALGSIPDGSWSTEEEPERTVYMFELRLLAAVIGTTVETEKTTQLRQVDQAKRRNESHPDAVWLPADHRWPSPRLRITATETLLAHFELVRKAEIPTRLLRGSSFPTTR